MKTREQVQVERGRGMSGVTREEPQTRSSVAASAEARGEVNAQGWGLTGWGGWNCHLDGGRGGGGGYWGGGGAKAIHGENADHSSCAPFAGAPVPLHTSSPASGTFPCACDRRGPSACLG